MTVLATRTHSEALAFLLTELSFAAINGVEVLASGSLRVTHEGRVFLVRLEWDDCTDDDTEEDA